MKDQKKELLPLFSKKMRDLIENKHISGEGWYVDGRQLHIIYIADDEWAKNHFKETHVKEPDFENDFYKGRAFIDTIMKNEP